jgi:hypothetical protein
MRPVSKIWRRNLRDGIGVPPVAAEESGPLFKGNGQDACNRRQE